MRGFIQHTNRTRGIGLQRTIEHKKPAKLKVLLDLFTMQLINLHQQIPDVSDLLNRKIFVDETPTKSEDTRAFSHQPFERLFVAFHRPPTKHTSDRFRCSFHSNKSSLFPIFSLQSRNRTLSFQRRRELEASSDDCFTSCT